MSKRKTIQVKDLVDHVNSKLNDSDRFSQVEKSLLCNLLEHFLHETGNYAGYNHNFNWNEDPDRGNKEYDRHYYYKG